MTRSWFSAAGRASVLLAGLLAVGRPGLAEAAERQPVVAYGILQKSLLNAIKDRFEASNPDLQLSWINDSAGVVAARIRAEGRRPQADVAIGLGLLEVQKLADDGFLTPYEPDTAVPLPASFRDAASPPHWTAFSGFTALICFNTREAEAAGVAAPSAFADLLRPEFRGRLLLPHPASSGIGFLFVTATLQRLGESGGWAFLDALHQNVAYYVHSGSAPCVQVARGEHLVGIGIDAAGAGQKVKGAPLSLILPSEGLPWDLNTAVLLNGAPHPAAARRLLEFTTGPEMAALSAQNSPIVPRGEARPDGTGFPAIRTDQLAAMDFRSMALGRDRVLAEWSRRYEGKSAPKP